MTLWPGAISIGVGGGSSAQRGVACSQRGWDLQHSGRPHLWQDSSRAL